MIWAKLLPAHQRHGRQIKAGGRPGRIAPSSPAVYKIMEELVLREIQSNYGEHNSFLCTINLSTSHS